MSFLWRRATYTNVAVTLALVFAMTGGAYAANHYLITSTKQISPKVRKALKGKAGPAGPTGPAGAGVAGPRGPQGPAGANGTNGANGSNGESVTIAAAAVAECKSGGTKFSNGTGTGHACNGEKGAPGPEGNIGKTLPSKSTETGAWVAGPAAATGHLRVAISFPIPLVAPLSNEECGKGAPCQAHVINVADEEVNGDKEKEHSQFCTGSVSQPTAEPGNLCVYVATEENVVFTTAVGGVLDPATGTGLGTGEEGAGETGAVLSSFATEPEGTSFGTWAVTAP